MNQSISNASKVSRRMGVKQDYQQQIADYLKTLDGIEEKYSGAGCYSISIDDELVYIGKSINLFRRLVEHMYYIHCPFGVNGRSKYLSLLAAHESGRDIKFDVVYKTSETAREKIEKDISYNEALLINSYRPRLNKQIPNLRRFVS